jgi:hypothetical protein
MSQISKSIMVVVFVLACTNVFANDLAGDWKNPDPKGGLTRIVVSKGASDNAWQIQAWGACSPTDCDWGRIDLQMLGDAPNDKTGKYGFAHWDHKFADTFITLRITKGILVVETYDFFKDGSGRANYCSTAKMERQKTEVDLVRLSRFLLARVLRFW